ncbi:hypothetical protein DPMN_008772 [Dreissena polymorpha]|uniref:Uncharacterized protein n=1 Tax=Dreissena polymorpha TaxID=45954 RepID=A0A9D4MZE5_DREPO|nr:hypothetical protein DPMN_008772 [Dreissena polymorpha]
MGKTKDLSQRLVQYQRDERKTCRKDSSYIREMGKTKDLSQRLVLYQRDGSDERLVADTVQCITPSCQRITSR